MKQHDQKDDDGDTDGEETNSGDGRGSDGDGGMEGLGGTGGEERGVSQLGDEPYKTDKKGNYRYKVDVEVQGDTV